MHLTLIRHGESTWNACRRWQGQSDVPLSPRGRLEARALAARMFGEHFDHAYASDLERALETAAALGFASRPEPRLREIDVGAWAGLTHDEVAERFADEVAALRAGAPVRIGGGESMDEFEARVDAAIDDLAASHEGARVLCVTHGGVVRALATRVLDARGRPSPLVGVGNTSVSAVVLDGDRLRLERYNDAAHLGRAERDSAAVRLPEPATRLTLIAADPDGEADRPLVDAILSGLGIARYYAVHDAREARLAVELFADAVDALGIDALFEEHTDDAFAILAPPAEIPGLVAGALGLPSGAGLAVPAHGALAQLRRTERRTELYAYGVTAGRIESVPLA
ncbi:MAG: histidine phosphatase family protein [Sandaracinaceae bacterium]|nr:histidine phosphatase family protein [Sandaracinaceae bacterium]